MMLNLLERIHLRASPPISFLSKSLWERLGMPQALAQNYSKAWIASLEVGEVRP